MSIGTLTLLASMVLLPGVSLLARGERTPSTILLVDIAVHWRTAAIPSADRGAVLDQIAAIWARYGVQCVWRHADRAADIALIVQDEGPRPANGPRVSDLGWVTFRDGVPDPVLHVSVDGVRKVAESARMNGHAVEFLPSSLYRLLIGRIVARAAAHELGHYLLRSAAHTRRGLMRAWYSGWEAGSLEPSLVELDPADVVLLHRRVNAVETKESARRDH